MKKLFRPSIFISAAIAAAVIAAGIFMFGGQATPPETVAVVRGTVAEEVSVTGRVEPAERVDLAFEISGTIAEAYADAGARVLKGALLAALRSGTRAAEFREAEANVKAEEAKLLELKRGTRPEELAVQETKATNARAALRDAKQNLGDKLEDTYTKSDDAVRNRVDQFVSNPRSSSPELLFSPADGQLERDFESGRILVERTLLDWRQLIAGRAPESDLAPQVRAAYENLAEVKAFLDRAAFVLNQFAAHATLSQTTLDGWRDDVSTGRTNVNAAINALTVADEKRANAASALALTERELALMNAGTAAEEIAAQEAAVEQARAKADRFRGELAKTALRAPFAGSVARRNAEPGEAIAAHAPLFSFMSDAEFEIEANVPEADIAKVRVGSPTRVTLDAYGSDVAFRSVVIKIDPAETVIDGVPTYVTTFQFAEKDDRVRSGMTANIDIEGERRENVLVIPQRAVFSRMGGRFVRRLAGGEFEEIPVTIGLRGSDGNVEVREGLAEGDRIAVSVREE